MWDSWRPRNSWRRLYALASNLPPASPFVLAVTDGESAWGVAEHLAAGQLDALNVANYQRQGKRTARKPKPIPRPGVESDNGERFGGGNTYSEDEIRAFLDGTDGRKWVEAT